MGEAAPKIHLSVEEYLALEQSTGERHEYVNGEAWAMAGGTVAHSAVKVNLTALMRTALQGHPCRPMDSDLKIHVVETGLSTYPDLSVFCGPLIRSVEVPHAGTNPTLLAEVLSPSTEGWDRGGKFAHCRRLPSLRYYLMVSLEPRRVELYTREDDGSWRLTEHGPGTTVTLPALGVSLEVDALFADMLEEVAG